jgi:hypothetical protein
MQANTGDCKKWQILNDSLMSRNKKTGMYDVSLLPALVIE